MRSHDLPGLGLRATSPRPGEAERNCRLGRRGGARAGAARRRPRALPAARAVGHVPLREGRRALARTALPEVAGLSIDEAALSLAARRALPGPAAEPAGHAIALICERHALPDAARWMEIWLERECG